jgi:hypothetical protein
LVRKEGRGVSKEIGEQEESQRKQRELWEAERGKEEGEETGQGGRIRKRREVAVERELRNLFC